MDGQPGLQIDKPIDIETHTQKHRQTDSYFMHTVPMWNICLFYCCCLFVFVVFGFLLCFLGGGLLFFCLFVVFLATKFILSTGVARPMWRGGGAWTRNSEGPQTNGVFNFILIGGPLDTTIQS